MILELDCGNTRIKWRLIDSISGVVGAVKAVKTTADLLAQLQAEDTLPVRGRLVSVRSDAETQQIVEELSLALKIHIVLATPHTALAGVQNGYEQFERLGMDRWLALVGAYQLVQRACLVIDLGTAVTLDLVKANGHHLGGFITPGLPMLRNQLLQNTRRVRYSAEEADQARLTLEPGRNTAQAVERGCLLMLTAYIEQQIAVSAQYLGTDFSILATGGDAALIADLNRVQVVPDLVFQGLAIACP